MIGQSGYYFTLINLSLLMVYMHIYLFTSCDVTALTYNKVIRDRMMLTLPTNTLQQLYEVIEKAGQEEMCLDLDLLLFLGFIIALVFIYTSALVFIYVLQLYVECECQSSHALRDLVLLSIPANSVTNHILVKLPLIRLSFWSKATSSRSN